MVGAEEQKFHKNLRDSSLESVRLVRELKASDVMSQIASNHTSTSLTTELSDIETSTAFRNEENAIESNSNGVRLPNSVLQERFQRNN